MKKLTLLVAGLAMGLASAFAAITPVEGTATETFTVPDTWKNVEINTTGWGGWYGGDITNALSNYKWAKANVTGNLLTIRFAFGGHVLWIKDGQAVKTDESVMTEDEMKNANGVDIWFNLGLYLTPEEAAKTEIGFHQGDANEAAAGTFTVNSLTFYGECENSGVINYAWESQDGSVKLNKIDVNGNIMDDLSFPNPIYWYDTYANAWMEDYPAVNQNFTFAIEAKDADTKAFCDYAGAGEAIPTFGIHTWDKNGGLANEHSGNFRTEKINDYIYGVDMNASAMKGSAGDARVEGAFELGVCGADESLAEFWFNATIAFLGDEVEAGETEAWWKVTTGTFNIDLKAALPTADVMPAIDAEWGEKVGNDLLAGVNAFGTTTGIEDVIADSIESGKAIKAIIDGNVVIVKGDEVFSILGAKIK
jgi:hypothetical protein